MKSSGKKKEETLSMRQELHDLFSYVSLYTKIPLIEFKESKTAPSEKEIIQQLKEFDKFIRNNTTQVIEHEKLLQEIHEKILERLKTASLSDSKDRDNTIKQLQRELEQNITDLSTLDVNLPFYKAFLNAFDEYYFQSEPFNLGEIYDLCKEQLVPAFKKREDDLNSIALLYEELIKANISAQKSSSTFLTGTVISPVHTVLLKLENYLRKSDDSALLKLHKAKKMLEPEIRRICGTAEGKDINFSQTRFKYIQNHTDLLCGILYDPLQELAITTDAKQVYNRLLQDISRIELVEPSKLGDRFAKGNFKLDLAPPAPLIDVDLDKKQQHRPGS